jgi:hypothetical protein
MIETSSRRPPIYVWIAWSLVVLDLIGFFAVLAGFRWGPAHGEGALGCMGITAIGFLPLLALAGFSTYFWRRRRWKELQAQLELKAKVRQVRDRDKA